MHFKYVSTNTTSCYHGKITVCVSLIWFMTRKIYSCLEFVAVGTITEINLTYALKMNAMQSAGFSSFIRLYKVVKQFIILA